MNLDKKEEDKESQHTGVEDDSGGEYSDPDNEENFVTKGKDALYLDQVYPFNRKDIKKRSQN